MTDSRATMLETLGRINVPKSSDLLAERLKAEILGETYPAGSALPTERELVLATGLSRGSVREALRMLEAQGLVHARAGHGLTVSRPTDALLAGHIRLYAKGRSVPLRSLVEVRQALEPMIAFLAATNRTDEDLAELHAIAARLEAADGRDAALFLDENANWHLALAAASHNELLSALMLSVRGLMLEASRIEVFASADVRARALHAHRRILEAIVDGDGVSARRRADRDVQAYGRLLEAAMTVENDESTVEPVSPALLKRTGRPRASRTPVTR